MSQKVLFDALETEAFGPIVVRGDDNVVRATNPAPAGDPRKVHLLTPLDVVIRKGEEVVLPVSDGQAELTVTWHNRIDLADVEDPLEALVLQMKIGGPSWECSCPHEATIALA